MLNYCMEYYMK